MIKSVKKAIKGILRLVMKSYTRQFVVPKSYIIPDLLHALILTSRPVSTDTKSLYAWATWWNFPPEATGEEMVNSRKRWYQLITQL